MVDQKTTQLADYTPPIDTDVLPIVDITTTTTKKVTWANIKAALKTYFDSLTTTLTNKTLTTPVIVSLYQDAGKTKLMTLPSTTSDTLVALAATQTETNKTLTTPVIISLYQDAGKTKLMTIPSTASDTLVALIATQTMTNKRITKRVGTVTSSSTPTPTADTCDVYTVTALAAAAAFAAPTGTPTNGQTLLLRILDNGTARALSWNAIYRFSTDLVAPTTTILSKTMYVGFIYNSAASKWDCVFILDNF